MTLVCKVFYIKLIIGNEIYREAYSPIFLLHLVITGTSAFIENLADFFQTPSTNKPQKD